MIQEKPKLFCIADVVMADDNDSKLHELQVHRRGGN